MFSDFIFSSFKHGIIIIHPLYLQSLVEVGEGRPGYDSMAPVAGAAVREGEDEEQPQAQEHHDENKPRERSPIETIFVYIMKQSYAASLIIMMVCWSHIVMH